MREGGHAKREPQIGHLRQPERIYRGLDSNRANILYAVLVLQNTASGATQSRLAESTGYSKYKIVRLLQELRDAGYIRACHVYGRQARYLYEIEAVSNVTIRDTAVILLELLEFDRDHEGKVKERSFISYLLKSGKLRDFSHQDIVGTSKRKGKIDMLVEETQHIERVTTHFIKPRVRTVLERPYLELVARQPPLALLKGMAVGST